MKPCEEIHREILGSMGNFCWDFRFTWFVETKYGNFIWKDPDYGGDNSFTQTIKTFCQYNTNRQTWRDKGDHQIEKYFGGDINIILLNP